MSIKYAIVGWTRSKLVYDAVLLAAVAVYLWGVLMVGPRLFPGAGSVDPYSLRIKAFGSCAYLLLSLVLMIGPLARLDARFLPLLYNRRHFGVITCLVAVLHADAVRDWYFAFSDLPPLTALLTMDGELLQGRGVSFIPFGIVALLILMVMAATSHDFWLAFLGAPSWKRLHLLVYVAYFSATVHVLFGAIQDAQGWGLPGLALGSVVSLLRLHGLAARRGARALRTIAAPAVAPADPPPPWLDAGPPEAIPEDRAIILYPPDGEPVAIFRHAGTLSAVSNLCAHQNGPLGEGRIVDGCITCPWHGFQYRPDDGCSPPPFTEKIATYRLMLHDGRLWLDPRANPPGTKVRPLPFAPPQPPSAP